MHQNTPIKLIDYFRNDKIIIVTLLLMLGVIIKLIFGFHEYSHTRYSPTKIIQWRQPSQLSVEAYKPISNQYWQQELIQVEKILWQINKSSDGKIIIDDHTLSILSQAEPHIIKGLSLKDKERLKQVIAKSFIGDNGSILANLVGAYVDYHPHYQKELVKINQAQGVMKQRLLEDFSINQKKMQENYFGKNFSEKLFSKQNLSTNYFNQRRLINMDDSLSSPEKKRAVRKFARVI